MAWDEFSPNSQKKYKKNSMKIDIDFGHVVDRNFSGNPEGRNKKRWTHGRLSEVGFRQR